MTTVRNLTRRPQAVTWLSQEGSGWAQVNLSPGRNDVDDALWAKAEKSQPKYVKLLKDNDVIQVETSKKKSGKKTKADIDGL